MTTSVERLSAAIAGRYRLEGEVGRGGMATVYLAQDLRQQRRVAVKVLSEELALAVGPARFLREIEVAARFTHPHILPLHDSGDADGVLYYVMPFVEGESLREKLERERLLQIDEAIRIAREIADALAYAHARGVLHRDVKPANIMLDANHAMLTDFGIALLAQAADGDRLTSSRVSLGTPLYMSPEQASADEHLDGRTDVYSLGCVLYEMLTGDPPFRASTPQAVFAKKLVEPVAGIRVVREAVSPALERAVLQALARMPADRFPSAAAFGEALDAAAFEQTASRASIPLGEHQAPRAVGTATYQTPPWPARGSIPGASSVTGWLAAAALLGGLLTGIGLVTTIVYDVVLNVPSQFTPSRMDFPLLGIRALIPAALIGFMLLVGFALVSYPLRLLGSAARRVQPVDATLRRVQDRVSSATRGLRGPVPAPARADLYLASAAALSISAFLLLVRQLPPSARTLPLTSLEVLSCSYRSVHSSYTVIMVTLVLVLGWAWWATFRRIDAVGGGSGRVVLARWAGLAWILLLVVLTTAPWRLLWTYEQRALLNGERAYILIERANDVVLYNATRNATQQYRVSTGWRLERLGTQGYRFESESEFALPGPGC